MSGARPRLGSSHSSSFGRLISARAIASICCSPPDRLPACWSRRSAQARERLVPAGRCRAPTSSSLAGVGADAEVVLDGELGERAAALRHLGDAEPDDLLGRASSMIVLAVERDRRPAAAIMPEIARIVVVLPAPLAPRMTTTSPCSTVEVDVVEHLDRRRSRRRRPAHLEQRVIASAPEVGLDDRSGRCCTSAGRPSAILRPKSIATTLSEIPITIAMWCSTSSTVRPNSSRIAQDRCRRARRPRRG